MAGQWTACAECGERRKKDDAFGFRNVFNLFSKNVAYGYSSIQGKLREATSIESTGPSTRQLHELAEATHHP